MSLASESKNMLGRQELITVVVKPFDHLTEARTVNPEPGANTTVGLFQGLRTAAFPKRGTLECEISIVSCLNARFLGRFKRAGSEWLSWCRLLGQRWTAERRSRARGR